MPWSLSDHEASLHSIPITANAKNAIGRKQAGCLRKRRNERGSTVGINAINQRMIKTATAVVDHGREAATRIGYMSKQSSQKRDRRADEKSDDFTRRLVSACTTSGMLTGLCGWAVRMPGMIRRA